MLTRDRWRMSEYPDNEFPWTFYFNGIALPKVGRMLGNGRRWQVSTTRIGNVTSVHETFIFSNVE